MENISLTLYTNEFFGSVLKFKNFTKKYNWALEEQKTNLNFRLTHLKEFILSIRRVCFTMENSPTYANFRLKSKKVKILLFCTR
jgi:hypothetical protein